MVLTIHLVCAHRGVCEVLYDGVGVLVHERDREAVEGLEEVRE